MRTEFPKEDIGRPYDRIPGAERAEIQKRLQAAQASALATQLQLEEAQTILAAIRSGKVDTVLIDSEVGPPEFVTIGGAEEPHRIFVETMKEGAVIVGEDGTITFCNERFAEMVGMPSSRIVGASLATFIPSLTAPLADPKHHNERQTTLSKSDGSFLPTRLSIAPIPAGLFRGHCVLVADLTESKDLLEKISRQAKLLDISHDAIILTDLDNKVLYWNQGAEDLYGWPSVDALGKNTDQLLESIFPEDFSKLVEDLSAYGHWEGQILNRTRDGREIVVSARWTHYECPDGTKLILKSNNDITAQKKAEEALILKNRELESAVRERTRELQAELKARTQAEEESSAIFRLAGVGMAEVDAHSASFRRVNQRYCELTGYTEGELKRLTPIELTFPPEDRPTELERLRRLMKGEVLENSYEKRYLRKDGTVVWVLLNARVIRDATGKPLRSISIVQDITPQKIAEEERRKSFEAQKESEERLCLALDAAGLGTFHWDLKTNEYVWSPRAEAIFGLKTGEFAGTLEAFLELVHPEDRERVRQYHTRQYHMPRTDAPEPWEIEFRIVRRDGSMRWVYGEAKLNFNGSGEAVRVNGVVQDVTEKKAAQAELEDRARLLELSHDAILIRDSSDKIVFWNHGASETYGYSEKEALGKVSHELLKTRFPVSYAEMMKRIDRERRWDGELIHTTRSGEQVTVQSRWALDVTKEGKYNRILETNTDISARKAAEAKLEEANISLERRVRERTAELKEANKELESFSYSVSHDLKSPLRAVSGFANMLLETAKEKLNREEQRYLSVIHDNANNMGELIDDLLSFSKVGRKPLEWVEVNMQALADRVRRELEGTASGRAAIFQIHEMSHCCGDPAMLRQVFANLISNAIKFTSKVDQPRIVLGGEMKSDEVIYYVKDNGIGFDMKYADQLFGVFQRLHEAEGYEGTGVGLAIVHRIIKRHGGKIWANSQEGQGAAFYFSLPIRNCL